MQSGIGDRAEVQRLGIPLVQYLSSMGHPSIFPGEGLPSATMILHSMRRGPATHIGHLHVIGGRFIQTCDRPASAERKINHNVQWKLCGSRSRSRKNFGPIEIEVHQIGVDQAAVDMPSLTNICRRINHAAACASLFAGIPYMPIGVVLGVINRVRLHDIDFSRVAPGVWRTTNSIDATKPERWPQSRRIGRVSGA